MHSSRVVSIVGVVAAIIGLLFTSANTDAAELLPTLNAADPAFPAEISTIWGGFDLWQQIVVVLLLLAVLVLALRPDRAKPMDKNSARGVGVAGALLVLISVLAWIEGSDRADTLAAGLAQAAGAGLIPTAFDVTPSSGFFVLILGSVAATVGGLFSLMQGGDSS